MDRELKKANEARLNVLKAWQLWTTQENLNGAPRTNAHADHFFSWLESELERTGQVWGKALSPEMVRGWLSRNGEITE